MSIRGRVLLALLFVAQPPVAGAADDLLAPFVAEYEVRYGSVASGASRTEVRRSQIPGQWIIENELRAHGLARLLVGGTVLQSSTFEADAGGLRPQQYRLDDGTARTGRDVLLEFDWGAGRVRGTAEDAAVDVAAAPGLQDAASIQAYVQHALSRGVEPGTIDMIETDRVKRYRFTRLRSERLQTAIGELDTVVYRSARDRSTRENLYWYAPALGYVMVRAEQRRDGKTRLQTRIRSYQPQG